MRAIVLLSGGIDSTLTLALAQSQGRDCFALSFDYGQRHRVELKAASRIAAHYNVPHKIICMDPHAFGACSLVNNIEVPKDRDYEQICKAGIPNTYVPARNTLFLAYAAGQAELMHAGEIYFGCNADDVAGYPDCSPNFVEAFGTVLQYATKQSQTGKPPVIVTPLIQWDKIRIIHEGNLLNIPFEKTHSCYDPQADGAPCKRCDACQLRQRAFQHNGLADQT